MQRPVAVSLRDPGADAWQRVAAMPLTYPHVGATAGQLPPDYDHMQRRGVVGRGEAAFRRAAEVVRSWDMHRGAGLSVSASAPTAELDVLCSAVTRIGPLRLAAPCRVIRVIDEPRRQGFAYGTLPGHPVRGEEQFVVDWADDDQVWLEVKAFSKPAAAVMRLGKPFTRWMQSRVTDRYIDAVRTAVEGVRLA